MEPSESRNKWNARHLESRGSELDPPSTWLSRHEQLLHERMVDPGARALDVACGRGRNSLYLAQLGFTVDAFDISDIAMAELERRARHHRLAVHPRTVDLTVERPGAETYDSVVVFRYLDRQLFPHLERALKPGGLLFYETFIADPARKSSMNPAYLLQPGELPRLVPDLEVLNYEESSPTSHDGRDRPQGRLLARRPT